MNVYKPGMAYIGKILQLSDIPDADFILRADVVCGRGGKWSGVIRKGDAEEGDSVVVFMPDAIVPSDVPELAFMEKHKYRVRPMRLRGCPSEVLIMPVEAMNIEAEIGTDVTDLLGVLKYEKEIPLSLSGIMAGAFPSFIPKTDEPNFQAVPEMREALVGKECVITAKVDGSSQTFYHRDGHFGGCSRNWELRDTPAAAVWVIAHRYEIMDILAGMGNFAVQWEAVGPKIQGNPLELSQVEPRVFDVWDIDGQKHLDFQDTGGVALDLGLPTVQLDLMGTYRGYTDDNLRKLAEGTYESGRQREGIVVRPVREMRVQGERLSFKVKNLLYREK